MRNFLTKPLFYLIFLFLSFFSIIQNADAQCGCSGGSPIGGSMPLSGTADLGMIKKNYIRGFINYRYSYGNEYYRHDMKAPQGVVNYFRSNLANLTINYGIDNQFLFEAECAYFLEKYENYTLDDISTSGPSNFNIGGRYNLFYDRKENFEVTIGGLLRIPFPNKQYYEELNIHLKPSSESFGIIFNSFIKKQIQEIDLYLFLINRFEFNLNNRFKFRYGNTYYNSFFALKKLVGNLSGILEVRNEIRQKDRFEDEVICDSGGFLFILSPQLSYTLGNVGISLAFDYPFYKYYYGTDKQPALKYNILINLFWGLKI